MNWLNKIKIALELNQPEETTPSALKKVPTDKKLLETIENAVIANKTNIERFFQKKYPQGIQSTNTPQIILDLKEDVLTIAAKLIDSYDEIPFHPTSQALLSNQIFGIAIEILGLKDKLSGWKDTNI